MNVLEVRGLCKQYPAFRLDNVSFDLPAGAVMGFIGRNGAGKSTTLKAMLGLVHSEAGSVRIFGDDFTQNERAVKQRLGIVLGGIDFYPQKRVKTVAAAIRRFYAGWDEKKYRYYLGLFDIDENKKVSQLSSGMKVKVMIAFALSHGAQLLILDEPPNHLAIDGREALINALNEYNGSVILITHDIHLIELIADNLWLVKDGCCRPYDGDLADYRNLLLAKTEPEKKVKPKPEVPKVMSARKGKASACVCAAWSGRWKSSMPTGRRLRRLFRHR